MTSPESEDTPRPDPADPGAAGPAVPPPTQPLSSADVDAAFAAIVAGWATEGAPRWPDTDRSDPDRPDPDGSDHLDPDDPRADPSGTGRSPGAPDAGRDGPSSGVGLATPPGGARRVGASANPSAPDPSAPDPTARAGRSTPPAGPRDHTPPPEDEHFEPPEPPPLPRVGASSLVGLLLLVIGVVLLAVPGLMGDSVGLGIVPGLLAMTAGLGWLVFGLRRASDRDDDPNGNGVV